MKFRKELEGKEVRVKKGRKGKSLKKAMKKSKEC